jgi:DNA-binding response OmpR family regulator
MARILLVDDDVDQLEIRKLLLETEGHEVDVASDGKTASRTFEERRPGLVVMDLRLPGVEDGRALIRDLRARSPSVRIVVLSGLGAEVLRLPEAGLVDQVLHKPFPSGRFLDLISKLSVLSS